MREEERTWNLKAGILAPPAFDECLRFFICAMGGAHALPTRTPGPWRDSSGIDGRQHLVSSKALLKSKALCSEENKGECRSREPRTNERLAWGKELGAEEPSREAGIPSRGGGGGLGSAETQTSMYSKGSLLGTFRQWGWKRKWINTHFLFISHNPKGG